MSSKSEIQNDAVRSIVQQWNGGEHKLAGARASELVYGKSNKPNPDLMIVLMDEAPGIERYITAPTLEPIEQVPDQGGTAGARQPENRPEAEGASNLSSAEGKREQDRVDDALAEGREAREKAGKTGSLVSTKLNPDGSDQPPKDSDSKTKSTTTTAKAAKAPAKLDKSSGPRKPAA